MAAENKKVGDETNMPAGSLLSSALMRISQGGANYKLSLSSLLTWLQDYFLTPTTITTTLSDLLTLCANAGLKPGAIYKFTNDILNLGETWYFEAKDTQALNPVGLCILEGTAGRPCLTACLEMDANGDLSGDIISYLREPAYNNTWYGYPFYSSVNYDYFLIIFSFQPSQKNITIRKGCIFLGTYPASVDNWDFAGCQHKLLGNNNFYNGNTAYTSAQHCFPTNTDVSGGTVGGRTPSAFSQIDASAAGTTIDFNTYPICGHYDFLNTSAVGISNGFSSIANVQAESDGAIITFTCSDRISLTMEGGGVIASPTALMPAAVVIQCMLSASFGAVVTFSN